MSNAAKYMDKSPGRIKISATEQSDAWHFAVADNGPGIETEHFDRVFQMFQTLAPRDECESIGIGLAIVKKIVESYGGRVSVESTLGEGSTFSFTVPHKRVLTKVTS